MAKKTGYRSATPPLLPGMQRAAEMIQRTHAEIKRSGASRRTLPSPGGGSIDSGRIPKPKLSREEQNLIKRMKEKK